jgi:hypothetical protein
LKKGADVEGFTPERVLQGPARDVVGIHGSLQFFEVMGSLQSFGWEGDSLPRADATRGERAALMMLESVED